MDGFKVAGKSGKKAAVFLRLVVLPAGMTPEDVRPKIRQSLPIELHLTEIEVWAHRGRQWAELSAFKLHPAAVKLLESSFNRWRPSGCTVDESDLSNVKKTGGKYSKSGGSTVESSHGKRPEGVPKIDITFDADNEERILDGGTDSDPLADGRSVADVIVLRGHCHGDSSSSPGADAASASESDRLAAGHISDSVPCTYLAMDSFCQVDSECRQVVFLLEKSCRDLCWHQQLSRHTSS